MRGSDLAEAMASAVDRIVSAREGTSTLDRAIEAVVGTIGRFSGKDAMSYLEAYRVEMVVTDIPEERHGTGFPRVVMSGIHAEVLEVWVRARPGKSLKVCSSKNTGLMMPFGSRSRTSWNG